MANDCTFDVSGYCNDCKEPYPSSGGGTDVLQEAIDWADYHECDEETTDGE